MTEDALGTKTERRKMTEGQVTKENNQCPKSTAERNQTRDNNCTCEPSPATHA